MKRLLVLVPILLLGVAPPAAGHEGTPGLDNVLDEVTPAVAGISVQVVSTVADEVVVENPTATPLTVLAPTGEPFLTIGRRGVLANLSSPTWAISFSPSGGGTPPPSTRPPRWVQVSAGDSWGWFDPRLPSQSSAPPGGARPGVPLHLGSWSVPMLYGSTPLAARGHLQYQPPTGTVIARLVTLPPGGSRLQLAVLPGGAAPGLYAALVGGVAPVTVLGQRGEPFIRLSGRGAEVNAASPTWAFAAQAEGKQPDGVLDPSAAPRWKLVSAAPRLSWIDPRLQYPPGTPPPDVQARLVATDLVRWTVPLTFGSSHATVAGVTQWVPDASRLVVSHHHRPVWWYGLAAFLLVLASAGLLVVRPGRRTW